MLNLLKAIALTITVGLLFVVGPIVIVVVVFVGVVYAFKLILDDSPSE